MSGYFVTPWTIADQAPLSMGFPMQEYWSGLSFPSLGDLPSPGIELASPVLQMGSLSLEPSGKASLHGRCVFNSLGNCQQFSKVAVPFYFPISNLWEFSCSTSLPTVDTCNYCHSGVYEMVFTVAIVLHFLDELNIFTCVYGSFEFPLLGNIQAFCFFLY